MERVIGGNKLYTDTDQLSSNLGFIGGNKLYTDRDQLSSNLGFIGGNKLYTDRNQFSSNLGLIGDKKLYNTQIQVNYYLIYANLTKKVKNLNVEKSCHFFTSRN